MATGWFFGPMLGYTPLGLALARAKAVPRWAAYLLVVAAPVMGPIAYGTGLRLVHVLGFLLVFIAGVSAAFAMLKGSPIERSLSPGEQPREMTLSAGGGPAWRAWGLSAAGVRVYDRIQARVAVGRGS